jgi:hypothetical protein
MLNCRVFSFNSIDFDIIVIFWFLIFQFVLVQFQLANMFAPKYFSPPILSDAQIVSSGFWKLIPNIFAIVSAVFKAPGIILYFIDFFPHLDFCRLNLHPVNFKHNFEPCEFCFQIDRIFPSNFQAMQSISTNLDFSAFIRRLSPEFRAVPLVFCRLQIAFRIFKQSPFQRAPEFLHRMYASIRNFCRPFEFNRQTLLPLMFCLPISSDTDHRQPYPPFILPLPSKFLRTQLKIYSRLKFEKIQNFEFEIQAASCAHLRSVSPVSPRSFFSSSAGFC